jgi:hypothetical protein
MPVRRGGGGPPRITGSEATSLSDLALPLPEVGLRRRADRSNPTSDVALPVTDDEPPGRIARRSAGGGTFRAILMIAALGGAGVGIWQLLNRPTSEDLKNPAAVVLPPDAAAVAAPPPAHVPKRERRIAHDPPPAPIPQEPAAVPQPAAAPTPTEPPPAAAQAPPTPAPSTAPPAPREIIRRPPRSRPNPYARARSYQKPEDTSVPGLPVAPTEPPRPSEEPTAPN